MWPILRVRDTLGRCVWTTKYFPPRPPTGACGAKKVPEMTFLISTVVKNHRIKDLGRRPQAVGPPRSPEGVYAGGGASPPQRDHPQGRPLARWCQKGCFFISFVLGLWLVRKEKYEAKNTFTALTPRIREQHICFDYLKEPHRSADFRNPGGMVIATFFSFFVGGQKG